MKLFASFSEAIREGAKLRPQFFGSQGAAHGSSCAVLAGIEAVTGLLAADGNYTQASRPYPYLKTSRALCPEGQCEHEYSDCLLNICWHLNDWHHWTREAIADWLESEEEKLGYVTLVESAQPTGGFAPFANVTAERVLSALTK